MAESFQVGLPWNEYLELQRTHALSPAAAKAIGDFLRLRGFERALVFGSSVTGRALQELLGSRFVAFMDSSSPAEVRRKDYDAVILATGPAHYPVVRADLLREMGDRKLPIVEVFRTGADIEVAVIVESLPRAGTHYTIENLQKCLNCGYATVFREKGKEGLRRSSDGYIFYQPAGEGKRYVVMAHFFEPLYYPPYRYVKTIYLMSFLPDAFHSWGKVMKGASAGPDYRLTADSTEWKRLQGFIPDLKRWLDHVRDGFALRYEDFYTDFKKTVRRLEKHLDQGPLKAFEPPRPNTSRAYFSDDYDARLDRQVLSRIASEFRPHLKEHWPEKTKSLSKRLK